MGRKWETIDLLRQLSQLEKTFELRDNFAAYVKASWHVYEPNNPMIWGTHHDAICDHLQAVYDGKIHKLLIALPPRHSKSSLASVAFPSWFWITKPSTRFINASYAMSLSLRDSQRCRQLIDSGWYQERFGYAFTWLGDQNKLGRYENTSRGYRLSSSVEGAATGEGGDCQKGDTVIQTDRGELALQAIVDGQIAANVLSYNHSTNTIEYKPIQAYAKRVGKPCVRVEFSNGTVVECTESHPFYVDGKEYIQAKYMQVGDLVYANDMYPVRTNQSHNVVRQMPQCGDKKQRTRTGRLEKTAVISITPIVSFPVYNIQVADNNNYFGNGILSHNCIIIDDAHNIQESESDTIREQTLSWWDRVMTSRLNDQQTGSMIVIGQRVHEQDLIGHLLEAGGWDYLCLPAEYEQNKKIITSIGWSDPRTEEGEPLWPAKFPKDILEYLKRVLGIHYFSQYQQSPVRDTGNIFKSSYFQAYTEKDNFYVLHHLDGDKTIHKSRCRTVISTDLALSKNAESDYTVILTWAVTPQMDFLLLDIVCERMEAPEAEELVWSKARAVKRLWTVLVEDVAYQKSAIQRLRRGTPTVGKEKQRRGLPITAYHPTTDKVSRAQSLVVWMSAGNFYFNEMLHGFAEYKRQLLGFPRSGKDDMVDATTITNVLFELGEPQVTAYDDMIDQITQEEEALLEIYHENNELGLWLMEEDGIEYLPYG